MFYLYVILCIKPYVGHAFSLFMVHTDLQSVKMFSEWTRNSLASMNIYYCWKETMMFYYKGTLLFSELNLQFSLWEFLNWIICRCIELCYLSRNSWKFVGCLSFMVKHWPEMRCEWNIDLTSEMHFTKTLRTFFLSIRWVYLVSKIIFKYWLVDNHDRAFRLVGREISCNIVAYNALQLKQTNLPNCIA